MFPERILSIRTNLSHLWFDVLNAPQFSFVLDRQLAR